MNILNALNTTGTMEVEFEGNAELLRELSSLQSELIECSTDCASVTLGRMKAIISSNDKYSKFNENVNKLVDEIVYSEYISPASPSTRQLLYAIGILEVKFEGNVELLREFSDLAGEIYGYGSYFDAARILGRIEAQVSNDEYSKHFKELVLLLDFDPESLPRGGCLFTSNIHRHLFTIGKLEVMFDGNNELLKELSNLQKNIEKHYGQLAAITIGRIKAKSSDNKATKLIQELEDSFYNSINQNEIWVLEEYSNEQIATIVSNQ